MYVSLREGRKSSYLLIFFSLTAVHTQRENHSRSFKKNCSILLGDREGGGVNHFEREKRWGGKGGGGEKGSVGTPIKNHTLNCTVLNQTETVHTWRYVHLSCALR